MTNAISALQTEPRGSLGTTILRIALGLTTLFTWFDNVGKDFYDGDNFPGFFNWAFTPAEEGGNGSSLGFVESIIDNTLLAAPEFFGWLLTLFELFIAVGLLLGLFTRAASLAAIGFFASLFLVYAGGEEWIWTYVLLTAAAVTVFLNWGGRFLGVDQVIAENQGESPATLIW
ncbi:MAG: hypothetical protein AAF567_09920 [Actinomycetota bacterium]